MARRITSVRALLVSASFAAAVGCGESNERRNITLDGTTTGNEAPTVVIHAPLDQAVLASGEPLTLTGTVSDDHDAPDALTLAWTSNRVTAPLSQAAANTLGGTTFEIATLAAGEHVITLGATDREGKVATASITVTINSPPGAPEVTITPARPTTGDTLVASVTKDAADPNRAATALAYSYRWLKNGVFAEVTTASVSPALTTKGEVWEVHVVANDGLADGLEGVSAVTIVNTPPTCSAVLMLPSAPNASQDITCSCLGWYDADGDAPANRCAFSDGATPLASDGSCTLSASATERGMNIQCTLTPSDGESDGDSPPVASSPVLVLNGAPTAPTVSLTPTTADASTTLTCNITAPGVDPDGDSVTHEPTWVVDGFEGSTPMAGSVVAGLLGDSTGGTAHRGSRVACRVRASDGSARSDPATSNEVVLGNASPEVGNVSVTTVGGGPLTEEAVVRCVAPEAADADGDTLALSYVWYVNGAVVEGAAGPELANTAYAKGDSVSCALRADDGHGGVTPLVVAKSAPVVANSTPSLASATLDKSTVTTSGTLTCNPGGWQDADGDPLEVSYAWYKVVGGTETLIAGKTAATITPDMLVPGDQLRCEATPRNGGDVGTPVRSATATIVPPTPTAPVVMVNAPSGASGVVSCDFVTPARYFAGTVSYTYYWRINGGTETLGTATVTGLHDCDLVACRAVASDGQTSLTSAAASRGLPVGAACATGDACHTATCKAAGGCDFVLASDLPCNDGNACTTDDKCELGFCVAGGFAGSTVACDDGAFCTGADACNGAGACVGTANPCQATAGSCLVGSCDEFDKKCRSAFKSPNAACSDGDGCSSGDVCNASGVCMPGAPVSCASTGDACNTGVCKNAGGTEHTCVREPRPPDVTCVSQDFCLIGTTCDGTGVCGDGVARDCAAEVGDQCNTAYCDPGDQACIRAKKQDGTSCDDGNACTLVDGCHNGQCLGGSNACVEARLNTNGPGQRRPAIGSLGYGRYVTQWQGTDGGLDQIAGGQNYLRLSDAFGSRENEEVRLTSLDTYQPEPSTPIAVQATGDFVVLTREGAPYGVGSTTTISIAASKFRYDGTLLAKRSVRDMTNYHYGFFLGARPLAFSDGTFGVLDTDKHEWAGVGATAGAIRYAPLAADLSPGSDTELVAADANVFDSFQATVVPDGSDTFLLAWIDPANKVYVQRFRKNGATSMSAPVLVADAGASSKTVYEVRVLGFSDSSFLVLWDVSKNTDGTDRDLYGQRYDASGNKLGGTNPFRLNQNTTGDQRLGDVARFADNGFVAAWDDATNDGVGYAVIAGRYNAQGQLQGSHVTVNTIVAGNQTTPTVQVLSGDEWVVAFIDDNAVLWTRRFNKDGTSAVGKLELAGNTTVVGDQANPKAAVSSADSAMLVYESPVFGDTGTEVLARVVDNKGREVKAEFQVNTAMAADQARPAVAGGPDRFVVVWDAVGANGGSAGLYGRLFYGDGTVLGAEFPVNVTAADAQQEPSVAMLANGKFVVTWSSLVGGAAKIDVVARLFAADGTPLTGELGVATDTVDVQRRPFAAAIPGSAGFVLGWESNDPDPNLGYEIYLRKFSAAGAPLTGAVRANSTTAFDQRRVAVSVAPNALGLLACWDSFGQDVADSAGVACRLFNLASLNSVGLDFVPYDRAAGVQEGATVAFATDGTALVGWTSEGLDAAGLAVQYQRLSAAGAAIGPRVVANRTWASDQSRLFMAPFALGHFMVGWESEGQDGDGAGVFFRVMPLQ